MKTIVVWFTGRGRCYDASLNGSPYTVARLAAAIMSIRGIIFVLTTYLAIVAYSIGPSNAAEVVCLDKFDSDYQMPTEPDRRAKVLELFPSGRLPEKHTCRIALIKGPIVLGDQAKLYDLVRQNHPFLDRVLLWSSGGLVEEALNMGRLIRKGLIKTEAPVNVSGGPDGSLSHPDNNEICSGTICHCAGACFFIWASGIERSGNALGIQRPATTSTSFASLPPDRASVLYRQLMLNIVGYLRDIEIPQRFIDLMSETSSRDMHWVSYEDADSMSVAPSIADWMAATCGAMSAAERYDWLSIGAKINFRERVTQQERSLYEHLEKKNFSIDSCKRDKVDKARHSVKVD